MIILDLIFLKENNTVEIVTENDSGLLRKATRKRRAKKNLDECFLNYTGNFQCSEWDAGKPVGKEVW